MKEFFKGYSGAFPIAALCTGEHCSLLCLGWTQQCCVCSARWTLGKLQESAGTPYFCLPGHFTVQTKSLPPPYKRSHLWHPKRKMSVPSICSVVFFLAALIFFFKKIPSVRSIGVVILSWIWSASVRFLNVDGFFFSCVHHPGPKVRIFPSCTKQPVARKLRAVSCTLGVPDKHITHTIQGWPYTAPEFKSAYSIWLYSS